MTGKQLKNSILQLAIQGKLVPQDPNDEPASVLLQHIRKEKEQLVKEGKLKKKDLVSEPITDEEKPFEIPESWEWVHLGDIFLHNNGKQLNRADTQGELHDYITTSNLYWDKFELKEVRQMLFTEEELIKCTATKGDLLVCEGGDVGRSAIWNFDYDICIQNHIHRVRAFLPLCTRYFLYLLMLNKSIGLIGGKGIGIQGFSAKALHNTLVALPPLSEQHRIVAKIEELMPLVEEYDQAQTKLNDLNEKLPDALKKSILQEAIQGKLVPQDPNDEPASKLMERIRKEKEQLVKEGKLKKKDLVSEPITDEEKPFEIPESWEWCRLYNVGITNTGTTPSKTNPKFFGDYIPFLGPGDIQNAAITYGKNGLSKLGYEVARPVPANTIIQVCIGGSIGKCAIIDRESTFNQQINSLTTLICSHKYMFYCMMSDFFAKQMIENSTGTATPIINRGAWDLLLIPIPPLSEQHRIVAKIEELFGTLK